MTKPLSENALAAYKKLYLSEIHGEKTPTDVHRRVAKFAASCEGDHTKYYEKTFFEMMESNRFRPNSPTMMNAGIQEKPQTSACFVGDLQDDMVSILDFDRDAALVYKSGSGIGGNYGLLRETNAPLSTGGRSSGPFSFLRKGAMTAHAVKSGGSSRRAAHMAMMTDNHPDLLEFIKIKAESKEFVTLPSGESTPLFSAMNLSIAASDDFMAAVRDDKEWNLVGVVDKQVKATYRAREIFDQIAKYAWQNGDPGIWFIDRANAFNTVPSLGHIRCTNPCVTGDTLVAVADGRPPVIIKELAEDGADVLVHCVDPKTKKALVRMGRKPRMTRKNMPILKITLDDGSFIRTTEDHKFLGFDGETIKAKELKSGQRLLSFIRYQAPNTTTGKMYWNVINRDGHRNQLPEHHMIADYHIPRPGDEYLTHHKNGNSLDNRPKNLEWLSISDHNLIEPSISNRAGEDNPMFGKCHSAETKKLIGAKTAERAADPEYQEKISSAIKAGMEKSEASEKLAGERVERIEVACGCCGRLLKMTAKEYTERLTRNTSGKVYCSTRCSATDQPRTKRWSREQLLDYGRKFIEENDTLPTLSSWDGWTREKETPAPSREAIRLEFGAFSTFKEELVAILEPHNHRVVSVEPDGVEDVYNITVDEVHTVAYITSVEAKTRIKGYPKHWGLYTRQCGEQALLPRQACGLGSINVAAFVLENGDFDWEGFWNTTIMATRFLDNCIDLSGFPTPEYEKMALLTRPIGLGIMGFADALILMGIQYGSIGSEMIAKRLARALTKASITASISIAQEKGAFPAFEENKDAVANVIRKLVGHETAQQAWNNGIRNSHWTTIAPTGTISISADCSQGMEPLFAICFDKSISDSTDVWTFVNPVFQERFEKCSWYPEAIKAIAKNHGSVKGLDLPEETEVFVCAHDVPWKERIAMQAALQIGISNSISSTINLPNSATPDDIKAIYAEAWQKGLKGITVYRDGCLKNQPIAFGSKEEPQDNAEAAPAPPTPAAPMKRPKIRMGCTHEVNTGHGKVYLTVNCGPDNRPMEIFTNGGKNGSVNSANLEAMARLVSIALQHGIEPEHLARTLENINDGTLVWERLSDDAEKSIPIISIPDAIGKVLRRFYCEQSDEPAPPVEESTGNRCPDCNSPTYMHDGCVFCPVCGSKCG